VTGLHTPPSLSWDRKGDRFIIHGRIDEHADLDRLAKDIPGEGATLDLADVQRINSVGTREWMDFLQGIQPRPIVLDRCSPAIVEQLNAIANFRGHAQIRTVMAVFECDKCESTGSVEVEIAETFPDAQAGSVGRLPAPTCEACGVAMKLDDTPQRYFMFVRFLPRAGRAAP
jgi:hypothetical protein